MYSAVFLALTALISSLVLVPIVRDLSVRLGLVDQPDRLRKIHRTPVPRMGGVAVFAAYLAAHAVWLALPLRGGDVLRASLPLVWKLFPAAVVIFATGVADDVWNLSPRVKLFGQAVAASLAYCAGLRVTLFAGAEIGDWWLSLPITVGWLMTCANAFNLIDGLDGLAAGIGLLATATILVAGLANGDMALALATAPLIGALLGFLRYNFSPASIFLGDCGSLLIGFLLGSFAIAWGQKSATLIGMTAPVLALGLPLIDVAVSVVRRFLRCEPIFRADRGHIHHRLLDQGLPPKTAALRLYSSGAFFASLALLHNVSIGGVRGIALVLFLITATILILRLKYVEFAAAGALLRSGAIRRMFGRQVRLALLERELQAVAGPDQCWTAVRNAAQDFGFRSARMRLEGYEFEMQADSRAPGQTWVLRIPIGREDYVSLRHSFDPVGAPVGIGGLAEVLHHGLAEAAIRFAAPDLQPLITATGLSRATFTAMPARCTVSTTSSTSL